MPTIIPYQAIPCVTIGVCLHVVVHNVSTSTSHDKLQVSLNSMKALGPNSTLCSWQHRACVIMTHSSWLNWWHKAIAYIFPIPKLYSIWKLYTARQSRNTSQHWFHCFPAKAQYQNTNPSQWYIASNTLESAIWVHQDFILNHTNGSLCHTLHIINKPYLLMSPPPNPQLQTIFALSHIDGLMALVVKSLFAVIVK